MNKIHALQNLLNGTATEEDIALLKRLLASGEISIGGNVNQSVIIIGSGNTVELPPAALDRLGARPMLGNLDRDLMGEEIASGLRRLDKLLPNRAPILLPHYKEQVGRLRPTLKTEIKSLSESAHRERVEALAAINGICVEAVDISFNGLCLGEEAPKYDARSPFRGLESFRPEDSEFFFGREALTQKLVGKIKAHSFLAVLGASGSGKSSLVMAGVIPALDSDYVTFRPGTKPLDELESARGKSLIVVDQFEELFTLTRDQATRKEFIARLLDEATRARIILTLRSDFLGEVGAYRALSAEIQNHLEIIPPMDMDELRRAMEGQAGVVGLRFEADLSQQILDDVAGEPGAMPLLQHALWELWNHRHGRNLRASEYRAFGGVKQAITSTAEKVYADCSKPEQDADALRDIFLRLTRLDEGDEGRDTRRRVPLGDLIPSGRDAASITLLLDKLANARLIVKTVNEEKTEVEVAHEALIRHWERLRIWLNEDRDALRLRESVSEDARRWENAGRDESLFNHRGGRLDDALALKENSKYGLTEIEQAYLNGCVEARKREQMIVAKRRRYAAGGVFVAMIVIIVILFGWSWTSNQSAIELRHQMETSEASQLLAKKQLVIAMARKLGLQSQVYYGTSEQETSVLLAIQATKLFPHPEVTQILQSHNLWTPPIAQLDYDQLRSVSFSPNGHYIVSGSLDNQVRIWDISTQQELAVFLHDGGVSTVAFSPDGRYVASGGNDSTVRVWDIDTRREIIRMQHSYSVNSVAFSPDGRYIVSGSNDTTARVWDVSNGSEIARVTYDHYVESVAFSPDSLYVAAGNNDGQVHIWNINNGQELANMAHDKFDAVRSVAFSPDGLYVASGSDDRTVRVWNILTGQEVARMMHDDVVNSVAFSLDGLYIISGGFDGIVRIWDLSTALRTGESPEIIGYIPCKYDVDSVAFSPDNNYIAVESGVSIQIIDFSRHFTDKKMVRLNHRGSYLELVAFSPDGQYAASLSDEQAKVWDVATMFNSNILKNNDEVFRIVGEDFLQSIAFSPDGRYIVSGNSDQTVRVWEIATGDEIAKMIHNDVVSVAFSPNGHFVASSGSDKTVRIWDIATGKEVSEMISDNGLYSVVFSPDGFYLAAESGNSIIVWDSMLKHEIARMIHGDDVTTPIVFSPNSQFVISGSRDGTVRIWDIATDKEISRMIHDDFVNSVAFSPDGRYVASGSFDGTARIWSAVNGYEIARMTYADAVTDIAFSPDSRYLGIAGNSRVAKVWDISTGQEIAHMIHDDMVTSIAFSPNGRYVISGSRDGIASLWIYRPEDLIADACSHVTRNLTRAEWTQYIGDALPYQAVCPNLAIEP